jgi:hypothetical protein
MSNLISESALQLVDETSLLDIYQPKISAVFAAASSNASLGPLTP